MVKLLVAEGDALASRDLARLYDTRTLDIVHTVCAENLVKTVCALLSEKMPVVVPAETSRWNDEMLTATAILEMLGRKPILLTEYLDLLHANPSALAGQPRLPVAGGNAHQPA